MANLRAHGIIHYFNFGVEISRKADSKYETRKAVVGAIGFRKDGPIVHAFNGGDQKYQSPNSHAEAALIRKLGKYSPEIYVARVRRNDGKFALARPCISCYPRIVNAKVKRVYYTIDENTYGIIDLVRMREYECEFL